MLSSKSSISKTAYLPPYDAWPWAMKRICVGRYTHRHRTFWRIRTEKYLHDNITHLFEDNENKIWAVTAKGLYYYNESDDNFLQAKDKEQHPLSAASICPWTNGVLFGGYGKIYKYNYADRQTELLCSLQPDNHYNITTLREWDKHTLLAINRWKMHYWLTYGQERHNPLPSKVMTWRTAS